MVNSNNRGHEFDKEDREAIDALKRKIYEDRENNTRLVEAELEEAQLDAKNLIAYSYENMREEEEE